MTPRNYLFFKRNTLFNILFQASKKSRFQYILLQVPYLCQPCYSPNCMKWEIKNYTCSEQVTCDASFRSPYLKRKLLSESNWSESNTLRSPLQKYTLHSLTGRLNIALSSHFIHISPKWNTNINCHLLFGPFGPLRDVNKILFPGHYKER